MGKAAVRGWELWVTRVLCISSIETWMFGEWTTIIYHFSVKILGFSRFSIKIWNQKGLDVTWVCLKTAYPSIHFLYHNCPCQNSHLRWDTQFSDRPIFTLVEKIIGIYALVSSNMAISMENHLNKLSVALSDTTFCEALSSAALERSFRGESFRGEFPESSWGWKKTHKRPNAMNLGVLQLFH